MSNKDDRDTSVDSTKREFMVKAGKYAVVGAGMATLMTPGASASGHYGNGPVTDYEPKDLCEGTADGNCNR